MSEKLNILICPLDWGLGHTGRIIPLARELKNRNNNIYIGGSKEQYSFLFHELQDFVFIYFQGFSPCYSRYLPQYIAVFLQLPLLFLKIFTEHIRLRRIIRDYKIDIVISDNRPGLWNRKIRSVYITHQLLIPLPDKLKFLETFGKQVHGYFIRKYTLCFIPDLPGDTNLTGRLTHRLKLPSNIRFIGILSRFAQGRSVADEMKSDEQTTVILSGPEPQRGILRRRLIELLQNNDIPTFILEGKPSGSSEPARSGKLVFYNHLPADKMKRLVARSRLVICRSGYTTIMELVSMNRTALLIPTPGQTEQEYLAKYLSGKGWFKSVEQKKLEHEALVSYEKAAWPSDISSESRELLEKALDELLNKQHEKAYSQDPGKIA